jgi:hypothetical protein
VGLVATELDDVLVATMRTENILRPAHLPNDFEALGIVDEVLDRHELRGGRVFNLHAPFFGLFLPKTICSTG